MQLHLDEVGIALMQQAVLDVLNGRARSHVQSPGGITFRKPTLAQVSALERRLSRLEPTAGSWPRRALKEAAFLGGIGLGYGPLRFAIAPRITVLLYHGVSDGTRDNLTVGIAQFERQMRLLREHCVVRAVEELITMREVPPAAKPQVCVTFDDGYLDNYVNAVPILERHGIPATFFVATGIVGTERPFPHDVQRKRALPAMSWNQLGDMLARGFGVGSHSVNHIDCAAEPENVVVDELGQSLVDLRRELSLCRVMFAYPYGGRQHMTPERLALVKKAGFVACLSAYGGSNVGTVDSFDVRRVNVHWQYSDRAFLFRCVGLA
jgi:peptidoglycan/xylan/chitin deacetylase (PgdA/CDA1 family)